MRKGLCIGVALAMVGISSCVLNPQPEPPSELTSGSPADRSGSGGGPQVGSSGDSSAGTGGASAAGDSSPGPIVFPDASSPPADLADASSEDGPDAGETNADLDAGQEDSNTPGVGDGSPWPDRIIN